MRIVIFAGGAGRRLWPISRESSPKQFEPIVGNESTVQMAVTRVAPTYGFENVFVATNERYVDIVRRQLPSVPTENILAEPVRRDLAAAVGLAMAHLSRHDPDEPVAILWSDNFIHNVPAFVTLLQTAETLIANREADILFIGETPRYANQNLGWIGLGDQVATIGETPYYRFGSLTYRPPLERCQEMFAQGRHVWNTGFFVTTPAYIRDLYRQHSPQMWRQLCEIEVTIGTERYATTLARVYPAMQSIHFDDAILTHVDTERAFVLHSDLGWSDPGTLYALKEALNPDPAANVTKGLVIDTASRDCLIYNYEGKKLVVAVGLEGMVVINTDDAILVVHKDHIPLVKDVVNGLRNTDLEHYG